MPRFALRQSRIAIQRRATSNTSEAATKAATARGARAGARLTDARALDPALIALPADPEGDAALVERLARWAGRWSPLVEVTSPGNDTVSETSASGSDSEVRSARPSRITKSPARRSDRS